MTEILRSVLGAPPVGLERLEYINFFVLIVICIYSLYKILIRLFNI